MVDVLHSVAEALKGLLSWKTGKGFLLPFPIKEAGTVQFLFPSPLDRIRSGMGRRERATQLGLNLARKESYEGNQSFPQLNNYVPKNHDGDGFSPDANICTMDKFRGDELNTFSFSPGHVRGSFAKTPDSASRTVSFNDSWMFYNLLTNGQATNSIPSNIHNPNKAVVTIDAKSSEILVANDMACRLFGYNSDELCKRRLADMFKHRSNQKAIVETHVNSSGEVVVVSGKVVDVVDSEGEIVPVSLWVKKLDTGSECRCLAVMEPVERTSATFLFDSNGTILSCDKTMAVLHGYSSSGELEGANIHSLIPSLILPSSSRIPKNIKKQQATGRTKDGASFPLSVIIEPANYTHNNRVSDLFIQRLKEPNVCHSLSSEFEETTENNSASTSSECNVYTAIVWVFANISGMITILPDGTIHSCNHYFALMLLGYTQSQLVGQNISWLIPSFYDDVEFLEAESSVLAPFDDEYQNVDEDVDASGDSVMIMSPTGINSELESCKNNCFDFSRLTATNFGAWIDVTESLRQLGIGEVMEKDVSFPQAFHKLVIKKEENTELSKSSIQNGEKSPKPCDLNGNRDQIEERDREINSLVKCCAFSSGSTDNVSRQCDFTQNHRHQKSLPETFLTTSTPIANKCRIGRSRSSLCLLDEMNKQQKETPLESCSSDTITDNVMEEKDDKLTACAHTPLDDPSIPEGSFFGLGRHRDGSDLSIIYQIKKVNLDDGQVLYCVWVSRDPEEPAEGGRAIGNLTLASSVNSTLDASASSISLGQIINEKAHLAESNQVGADHSDIDYVSGLYAERYTTLQQIGKGAFGCVKMAFRNTDNLLVITKFIRKAKVYDECWVDDNLLKKTVPLEVSLLTTLKHANIVQVLDVFENGDYFQMVMEKHGCGMDLFEFIDRGPNMDEPLASYIFRQVTSAVNYLHSLNILHRDIKDENIILDEHFHIKLIDFGSATFMAPGKLFSTFCGTVEYCSPEVLQGNKYRGPELEMWSLGVTLYTLIFGENPFFDVDETIKAVLRPPFQASKDLMHLIGGLLNPDPNSRFGLRDLEVNKWLCQAIDISTYRFDTVITCTMEEANPPRYYNDLEIGDNAYRASQEMFQLKDDPVNGLDEDDKPNRNNSVT